jgi:hypothetical protein
MVVDEVLVDHGAQVAPAGRVGNAGQRIRHPSVGPHAAVESRT